jgi:DNA-binding NarL/FixJ family response regulator
VRSALDDDRFRVVASAATIAELLGAGGAEADVVLIDEALFTAASLGGTLPTFRHTAVLTHKPSLAGLRTAIERGALGYIARDVSARWLAPMVGDLAAGIGVIPPSLTSLLLSSRGSDMETRADGSTVALTNRQAQVRRLAQQGLKTAEIAEILSVSPVTVRRHLSDVQAKLGGAASRDDHGLRCAAR